MATRLTLTLTSTKPMTTAKGHIMVENQQIPIIAITSSEVPGRYF
jgi:hypothetical protein